MSSRSSALTVLVLIPGILAGCADAAPTDLAAPRPDDAAFAQNPGQLTAGEIPETGVFRGVFPNTSICGIDVTTTVFDTDAEWPAEFGPPTREAGLNVLTWINEVNGNWVESRLTGQVTREILEFFPDGSFMVHETFTHGVQLRTATGAPLALSAGRLVLEFIVVPLPGGGFQLTSLETLFVAGPRDDGNLLQSPAFCAIVEDVLL